MLEVNNRNTRPRCEMCSKLTIKIPERRHFTPRSSVSIVNFEHVNGGWDKKTFRGFPINDRFVKKSFCASISNSLHIYFSALQNVYPILLLTFWRRLQMKG